jgi:ABC-type molybdate transport system substrate-binding protein
MLRRLFAAAVLLLCVQPSTLCARAVQFAVAPVDQVLDIHGDAQNAQLVVFASGNQYMVMPTLVAAFRKEHPQIRHIYYETLPPGIIIRQIRSGALQIGNMLVSARADVLLAGPRGMRTLHAIGKVSTWQPYASNTLAILVRAGNPLHVRSVMDLGRSDVRVVMPNPKWEGVAEQVEGAYMKAGGTPLLRTIMHTKLAAGTTMLTRIHHRETPLFLLEGRADAGPVWLSEALYQHRMHDFGIVRIPDDRNVHAAYEAARLTDAPHRAAADAFVAFLRSPKARAILAAYGFGAPR